MTQQVPGVPGILRGDHIRAPKHFEGAKGNVAEIANGSRYEEEHRGAF